jgi:TRAP-type uncharacterized transport system fused permease subunit
MLVISHDIGVLWLIVKNEGYLIQRTTLVQKAALGAAMLWILLPSFIIDFVDVSGIRSPRYRYCPLRRVVNTSL